MSSKSDTSNFQLNLGNLASGMYYLKVENNGVKNFSRINNESIKHFFIDFQLSHNSIFMPKGQVRGEKEILKGKWNWAYSVKNTWDATQPSFTLRDTTFAVNACDQYHLDFLEKGIVKSFKNGKQIGRKRIVFESFRDTDLPVGVDYSIIIKLNGRESNENQFGGSLRNDTLFLRSISFLGLPLNQKVINNIEILHFHFYIRE